MNVKRHIHSNPIDGAINISLAAEKYEGPGQGRQPFYIYELFIVAVRT